MDLVLVSPTVFSAAIVQFALFVLLDTFFQVLSVNYVQFLSATVSSATPLVVFPALILTIFLVVLVSYALRDALLVMMVLLASNVQWVTSLKVQDARTAIA